MTLVPAWVPAAISRVAAWVLAAIALGLALVLAWHHPLWPLAAVVACLVWAALCACRRGLWLFALPLGAAFLHFSPWTGWTAWDEYDLLLLSTLGGGYAQWAWRHKAKPDADAGAGARAASWPVSTGVRTLWLALAAATLWGLLRAWQDAQATAPAPDTDLLAPAFDWFAGYTAPANSLRVAKAGLYALLLVPLWPRTGSADGSAPVLRGSPPWVWGLLAGLAVVVGAVLWERLAFPGLLNGDTPYRTVGLFWEMHVGGEALDAYQALTTPFAVWAVQRARGRWQWGAAAVLAVLLTYAVLSTVSRGVYAAVVLSLTLLGWLLLRQRTASAAALPPALPSARWQRRASRLLVLLLLAEVLLLAASGRFLWQRMAATPGDLGNRWQHWQRGLGTLHGASAWLLGLGPGRLPTHYAAAGAAGEFSGGLRWGTDAQTPGHALARLQGPTSRRTLGGQFALAQRTPAGPDGTDGPERPAVLHLRLRVRAATELQAQWCERHLLYDGHCQSALLQVQPSAQAWQEVAVLLHAEAGAMPQAPPAWRGMRLALFTLSVVNAGGTADLDAVQLIDARGRALLDNTDFAQGLAHWQVAAQSYFLPWHIDNLLLELLIEQGVLGLLLFAALLGGALWRLVWGTARQAALAPYQAAALGAVVCVGATGSVLDVPRVALWVYLVAWDALLQSPSRPRNAVPCAKNQTPQKCPVETASLAVRKG